jgi:hypothetical protein|nr:LPD1 domain-containing protein [Neorhizobium tomejilense]
MSETARRRIDDAGEKIGGARKDWARERMSLSDVEGMTDEERVKHIQKDNIWPKPDFAKLVEGGMSAEAAALVKIIRDRIAKTPTVSRRRSHAETLQFYFEALTAVSQHLESCKTLDEVKAANMHLQRLFGRGPENPYFKGEGNEKYYSINRGTHHPVEFRTFDDGPKIRKLLAQGFPDDIPVWRRGYDVRKAHLGEDFIVIKGDKVVGRNFPDAEAALDWLKGQWEAAKADRSSSEDRRKVPERPHLEHIERKGLPDHREGEDVSEHTFMEVFGFRAVEFGNWLPDDERQLVLNHGYDAFMDLADALGLSPGQISLDGTLAIAFGARGQSGFAAHYEPGRRVVNLTRLSGAGAVAHEWGHALDHWLGTDTIVGMEIPSVSGWMKRGGDCRLTMAHRGDEIANASFRLMLDIMTRPGTRDERLADIAPRIAGFTRSVDAYRKLIESTVAQAEAAGRKPNAARMRKLNRELAAQEKHLENWVRARDAALAAPDDADFGRRPSNYFREAVKISGEGGYWARPNELFARAFESYVNDGLAENDASSNYLVAWAEERFYPEEFYKGNPYPAGEERKRLNSSWRNLMGLVYDIVPDCSRTASLVSSRGYGPAAK